MCKQREKKKEKVSQTNRKVAEITLKFPAFVSGRPGLAVEVHQLVTWLTGEKEYLDMTFKGCC